VILNFEGDSVYIMPKYGNNKILLVRRNPQGSVNFFTGVL